MICDRCGKDASDFSLAYRRMRLFEGHPDPGMKCSQCAALQSLNLESLTAADVVTELRSYLPCDLGDASRFRCMQPIEGGYTLVPVASLLAYADLIEGLIDRRLEAEG